MSIDVQSLIASLQPLKQKGDTPSQAAQAVLSSTSPQAAQTLAAGAVMAFSADPIPATLLSVALYTVYQEQLTPAELAIILHQSYPSMSATDIGRNILDPAVFPNTSSAVMAAALQAAGFVGNDVQDAVDILYPVTLTVQSNVAWQNTGVTLTGRLSSQITCTGGLWTANPATGMCGASGNSAYVAKPGYTLPGAYEGALIGQVGANPPFLVGNGVLVPAGQAGLLQFCINDDLNDLYGCGLADNRGSLNVLVSCS